MMWKEEIIIFFLDEVYNAQQFKKREGELGSIKDEKKKVNDLVFEKEEQY